MPSFGRVLTAMATPFTDSGALDVEGAQRLAAHLIDHGSDGVVVCGTTGESPTLTHGESRTLIRAVVEAVGDRATVVAGTGKNDTAATVALSKEAAAAGVDGLMIVTPYYNRPSQRGLVEHFSRTAAATDLPVLLYNIPSRTATEITPVTLLHLAETVPTIRGVKDAVGSFAKASWLVDRAPDTFEIWSGDDINLLPLLAVGGVGVVSVAAHLVGEDLARMVEVFPTDPREALRIHLRLLPLLDALFIDTNPVPLKAGLDLLGLPAGGVRAPLVAPTDDVVDAVRTALTGLGMEVTR